MHEKKNTSYENFEKLYLKVSIGKSRQFCGIGSICEYLGTGIGAALVSSNLDIRKYPREG